MVPTLFFVSVMVFGLQRLLPACDPALAGTAQYALAGVCSPVLDGSTAESDV
jgi:hypothetical protein